MKTRNKALFLTLCAVALVVATVFGTMAYLTSTDEVVNTFTVGKVAITLDEAKVTSDGKPTTPTERVKSNSYHLMPGHTYTKDPTVHVVEGSEDSYIFVKVENGIADFEVRDGSIAEQMRANDWEALTTSSDAGVYYKEYKGAEGAAVDFVVFDHFQIASDANDKYNWSAIGANTKVTVTAYAVQMDGFDDAGMAWAATFGK